MKFTSVLLLLFSFQVQSGNVVNLDCSLDTINCMENAFDEANKNEGLRYVIDLSGVANNEIKVPKQFIALGGDITLRGSFDLKIQADINYSGNLINVNKGAKLSLYEIGEVSGFSNTENGGAINVSGGGYLGVDMVNFWNNSTQQAGGAIYCAPGSTCFVRDSDFTMNHAGFYGGFLSCNGECDLFNIKLNSNYADIFACDIDAPFGSMVEANQVISTDEAQLCITNKFDFNGGTLRFASSYMEYDKTSDFASCTGSCENDSVVLNFIATFRSTLKAICNDFGSSAFSSLGHNVSSSEGCFFSQSSDISNANLMITVDENGIPQPNANSVVVESGKSNMTNGRLPCGYKDANGLGRPQDFDGDGEFTCDRGPVELQGGEDLTSAQSGLFYDVNRNGEGIIVEMLSSTSALVTMFTYHPNGTELMWLIGVGKVVGNSIVIDNLQRTTGGVFGPGFNPDTIVGTDIGGMSVIFPDCNASTNEGRMVFQPGFEFKDELESLIVNSRRLTKLLNCDNQSQTNPMTGRSGTFFDRNRSGEGVFVEVLDNGSAVVVVYTYTPDGKLFWFLSSAVEIDGNTITADMIYPATPTGFGSQFDSEEIEFLPWGTVTLEYQSGCDELTYSYNSTVNGYGSGSYNYNRLTRPAGTICDL